MWRVRSWNVCVFVSFTAASFSEYRCAGLVWIGKGNSSRNCCSHRTSLVTLEQAIYSASVIDWAVVSCRWELHIMICPFRVTRFPLWLFACSPPYDASAYAFITLFSWNILIQPSTLFIIIPFAFEDTRYRNTCIVACRLLLLARDVLLPSKFTCIEISGPVHQLMYKRLPTKDWYFWSWFGANSSPSFGGLNKVIVNGNDFVRTLDAGRPCSFASFSIEVLYVSLTEFLSHINSIPRSFFGFPSLSSSTWCSIAFSMSSSCDSVGVTAIMSSTWVLIIIPRFWL